MDIFAIFFLSLVSLVFGIILTLCVQYYVVYVYLRKGPIAHPYYPKNSLDYSLPMAIKKQLEGDLADKGKGGLAVSLVLQFLFHELRHSESIRRWLYKKLTLELDELLTKTTVGKFFDSINIKDMHLGSQFPDIKDIAIDNVKLDKNEEHIETVSLCLDVDYAGNFLLSVDARMKFGKTAYLSIKVKRISGLVRLQFSRQPYTHWSFSFFNEPTLDLAVESHFQGRQLQSNVTNLIMNQIKKAIKRKHTLPNYKIRYKPFFVKTDPSQLDLEEGEALLQGLLEVNLAEVSRLAVPHNALSVYCTVAVDSIPWISLYQREDGSICMTLEITVVKLKQAQLGAIFRQETGCVVVDSVAVNSCAQQAGLRSCDVVISVENKLVSTVPQVGKFMKSISGTSVTLRVERVVDNYVIRCRGVEESRDTVDAKCDDDEPELTQTEHESFVMVDNVKKDERKNRSPKMMPSNENMTKLAQTISSFSLRKRKGGAPGTPQKSRPVASKKSSTCDLPEIVRTDLDGFESEQIFSLVEVFKGKELPVDALLPFDDDFRFAPKDGARYVNVNAWATVADAPDILLGYLNVPLAHVAFECAASVLGHHSRRYSFLPPGVATTSSAHPLKAHSGFEHVFCFGDALLCFAWTAAEGGDATVARSAPPEEKGEVSAVGGSKHDFIRTQFHGTTHCDFCTKKIWLKDAVQCRQCGMSCHKKCVVKCQNNNGCSVERQRGEVSLSDVVLQADGATSVEETEQLGGSLKRVNSVTSLTVPGSPSLSSSKSLPPSPQRTPSRKQSLACLNPFTLCPAALEEVSRSPRDASETVTTLLEQVMACPPDENLMDAAKETGQRMYVGLSRDEKLDKINLMMAELKRALDAATSEHMEMQRQLTSEESEVERAKLAFLSGQADAKVHALSVLMLHYCSGLQYLQEKIV
ncbi:PDZ domain-containing protein 8 isoform X2 [Cylas formicarius]|uniref:PDZ domain-containing protein 8 isoform X2 n=1 Tax=Cylas formicarius TaxID=197179 RepID=UPI0029589952|nr:PDZ domain-containing protein 8 isoform X2 [Cylas formicarius]